MNNPSAEVGLIGLGTMGAALALNIADNDYTIAVFNRTISITEQFIKESDKQASKLIPAFSLEEFVAAIKPPRRILLMVPAGQIVDDQIAALEPLLDKDDIIIDCGNANYNDTNRRNQEAMKKDWRFLGIGVSGGEEGARNGPSIMVGGDCELWNQVKQILFDISAKHTDGTPCAAWLGEAGAGHFVKMIHNGIEYADMQMIAEVYGILRNGHGWSTSHIAEQFSKWNEGALQSYLIEITAIVAAADDTLDSGPLLDVILDAAGQKGTGRWTAIEAQHLGTSVPVIEAAVAARNLSAQIETRKTGEATFACPSKSVGESPDLVGLENALIAGKILCYAQGFELLGAGAKSFQWKIPMAEIARIWRAGCIIRSAMLDDMASALERSDTGLIFDQEFTSILMNTRDDLRSVVSNAFSHGLPVPALSSGLSWFDQICSARSTANLIQGQRDYFGLHGFKRLDREGDFHGPWASD